jgi:uncharacterized membrane protein YfcA
VFVAASLQGVTGFGFMMLALPGLILAYPAQMTVPALILVWIPLGCLQYIQLRREVDWRLIRWLVAGAVLTLPAGSWILKGTDTETMQRAIGALMVALSVLLQVSPGKPVSRERLARFGAGLLSGALAASTSVSGPPVVLLGLKQRWEAGRFRASLLTYFLLISLLTLPLHWRMDLLNRGSLSLSLAALPGLVLGFFSGWWLRGRVRGAGFRWIATAVVIGGGLAALLF